MRADLAQHLDIAEPVQPIGVVDHRGAGAEEGLEIGANAGEVGGDPPFVQQLPGFLPERGVADPGRAAAQHRDRTVAMPLEQPQQHDRDQVADMQRVSGEVEAGIAGERAGGECRVQPGLVRALEDEAACPRLLQKSAGHRPPLNQSRQAR